MLKNLLIVFLICFGVTCVQAQNKNEIAIMLSPISFEEQENFELLYRRDLNNEALKFRSSFGYNSNATRSTRSDSIVIDQGNIFYSLSAGLQRDLKIEELDKVRLLVSVSGYLNSESVKTNTAGYSTFWDFGIQPTVGINYMPYSNIRLGFEVVSDINRVLQSYEGIGLNKDQSTIIRPYNGLLISLGLLF